MRHLVPARGLVLLVGLACPGVGSGQDRDSPTHVISGSYTYRTYCATCHGEKGAGDGPLAEHLRFVPPNLSLLARKNGGEYPARLVTRTVDGREPVDGHGGPDMPVWGDAFKNPETGFDDEKVKARIQSVVDYIETLQQD